MEKNPLTQLREHGQSFWFDNIQRGMLGSGELDRMISEDDLRGITSNPSIFEKAINSGSDYDLALAQLARSQPDADNRAYFYELAIADIQQAADRLRPVYDSSQGVDGYVSLEVSPDLAYDTQASIDEARQLFIRINRPNAMIKIPSTREGLPVIETLIADGINVNATLLFSVERYVEVARAFVRGLQKRHAKGHRIDNVHSVASFFISRVDTLLDKKLGEKLIRATEEQAAVIRDLQGQGAILNAKSAYLRYQELFKQDSDFAELARHGAHPQRLLWASTGTKNPDYSDVLYVESLIGPETVNTIPPATYQAFKDHGQVADTLLQDLEQADSRLAGFAELGIELPPLMQQLEDEGVAAFAKSFDTLLASLGEKLTRLQQQSSSAA